jgi:hypothetical protein
MDTFGNQTDLHYSCLHIFCLLDFQAAGGSLQVHPSPWELTQGPAYEHGRAKTDLTSCMSRPSDPCHTSLTVDDIWRPSIYTKGNKWSFAWPSLIHIHRACEPSQYRHQAAELPCNVAVTSATPATGNLSRDLIRQGSRAGRASHMTGRVQTVPPARAARHVADGGERGTQKARANSKARAFRPQTSHPAAREAASWIHVHTASCRRSARSHSHRRTAYITGGRSS